MTKSRDLANAATALNAVTATELGFVDGVTSAIQTQIDAKAPSSTAVTLTGTQTLTNKTLTSPVLTTPTISTVNAKGDLLAGTADNTVDRLAVGSDGDTLVADSSTSTGLRYQGSMAAGRNFIINGGMDIWQRGTSFTNPGSTYTVDRWQGYWSANGTVTQETSNVPAGLRYALKMTATANSAGNNFYQLIETNNTIPLAGKTVTFSVYVAGTAGKTPIIGIDTSTVVDDGLFGSWTALVVSSSVTTSTTYQRVTVTATIPSNTKSIRVHMDSQSLNNTDYLLYSGIQLELGAVATPFSRAGGTIQGELAACQRYYYRQGGLATSGTFTFFGWGMGYGTGALATGFNLPTQMRVSPTVIDTAAMSLFLWEQGSSSGNTPTSITINTALTSPNFLAIDASKSATFTNGAIYRLLGNNTQAAYIGASAEL